MTDTETTAVDMAANFVSAAETLAGAWLAVAAAGSGSAAAAFADDDGRKAAADQTHSTLPSSQFVCAEQVVVADMATAAHGRMVCAAQAREQNIAGALEEEEHLHQR